jgi:predicted aspartyl protease
MMMSAHEPEVIVRDTMGMLRTTIAIENPRRPGTRHELPDALVDTGAELSFVPRRVLEELGIEPRKRIRFQMANGAAVERDVGYAVIYAGGTETNDEVVFGETGDLVLLGARSLQGLNLKVDLVGKRLVAGGPMLAAHGRLVA